MILKSTADGLKAKPVNPYLSAEQYHKWMEFDYNNPTLDLTEQMPGNTVFEGVEVWQGEASREKMWYVLSEFDKDHFEVVGNRTRKAYQPVEVKGQVREEADNSDLHRNAHVFPPVKASNPELGVGTEQDWEQ